MPETKEEFRLTWDKTESKAEAERLCGEAEGAFGDYYRDAVYVGDPSPWYGALQTPWGFMGRFICTNRAGLLEHYRFYDGMLYHASGEAADQRLYMLWLSLWMHSPHRAEADKNRHRDVLVRPLYVLSIYAAPRQALLLPSPRLSGHDLLALPEIVQAHYPGRFFFDHSCTSG